jgi:hypothetical protein
VPGDASLRGDRRIVSELATAAYENDAKQQQRTHWKTIA